MDILIRRTLKRTRPAALAGLVWAIGLALLFSAPQYDYKASFWRWLQLIVPGSYLVWVICAWVGLGQGRALEEVKLVTDPRRWVLPLVTRGLLMWGVLALIEVGLGTPDTQWFLFTPLMLTILSLAGMALSLGYLTLLPSLALTLVPLFTADWRANLPSLVVLAFVLARGRCLRGAIPITLGLGVLSACFYGAMLWLPLLICLPLLCLEAAFRSSDEVLKARCSGFWADLQMTPLGPSLFFERVSFATARVLLPSSILLAGAMAVSITTEPQSTLSCGMWTSCLCDAHYPERDEKSGLLACLAGAVALAAPLAANRLGLLVGILSFGRSQALVLATAAGLCLLALSLVNSAVLGLVAGDGVEASAVYQDWLCNILWLSTLTVALCSALPGRLTRPLPQGGPIMWIPVWLCLAQASHYLQILCSGLSLVQVSQDMVFIFIWASAAAQGLLGSLVYLCLQPRSLPMVAAYGLAAGLWAERCPALIPLEGDPGLPYLPLLGLALALILHKCGRAKGLTVTVGNLCRT